MCRELHVDFLRNTVFLKLQMTIKFEVDEDGCRLLARYPSYY